MKPADYLLVVEDSDVDFEILECVMNRRSIVNRIERAISGEQAIRALEYKKSSRQAYPAVILLDLNLIGMTGLDVISKLKKIDGLRNIPILVLTTSDNPKDIEASYREGAATYFSKPMNYEHFESLVDSIMDYWLKWATLLPCN